MHTLRNMKITCAREPLLETVRTNREEHSAIVAEAREGYVKKARAALEKRLTQLEEGKIVSLHFRLVAPEDHTSVYDTMVRMLELHTEDTVELDAQLVRNLEMDEWDWTDTFLGTAAQYSGLANDKLNSR
jgi:hypothetical protein